MQFVAYFNEKGQKVIFSIEARFVIDGYINITNCYISVEKEFYIDNDLLFGVHYDQVL